MLRAVTTLAFINTTPRIGRPCFLLGRTLQVGQRAAACRQLSALPPSVSSSSEGSVDKELLWQEVKLLGTMLGATINKHAGENIFRTVEEIRSLGREWRVGGESEKVLAELIAKVDALSADDIKQVSKAFAHFLALANAAESHQRVRGLRMMVLEDGTHALPRRRDSTLGTISKLLEDECATPTEIYSQLTTQRVELVMTAHPTEVNRRTLLHKHKGVSENLSQLFVGRESLTPFEKEELQMKVQRAVESIWNSDEVRRTKPSPQDEARAGIAIIEQVLWNAIPSWLRKLDDMTRSTLGKSLPTDVSPVVMASWMGGDRDGNPNVTPQVTLEVSFTARWQAASLLLQDVKELRMELSMTKASPELMEIAGNVREPYREVLKHLEQDLESTLFSIRAMLAGTIPYSVTDLGVTSKAEVLSTFKLLHRSLYETNQAGMADGMLTDVIRKVACFGLTLSPLDIRQESTRHSEAMDAITRWLGVGSYLQWDEITRQTWLLNELNSKRPLLPHKDNLAAATSIFSPTVIDTLETFNTITKLGQESLGAYVISMATSPSDVLAVKLLMKEHGVGWNMRVVPLFETLQDLNGSLATMESLFSLPWYRGNINGEQEVMIGYSDSAKDAGRLAAAWAQYEAQERLAALATRSGINLTFFHGKGGTVSRGGNPALYEAIVAQAPGTVRGRFRVTEQGEMLTQNFGSVPIAERTLDIYTAGVLYDGLTQGGPPKLEWRQMMEKLGEISCDTYRSVVRGDERFVPYFRSATPEQELGALNIGSRPAKRKPGGVETLRAIPWVFAWTQTRLNLPAWLGVGEALKEASVSDKATLDDMYANWPFFRTNIDLFEMVMAKAEPKIAAIYDSQLVKDPEALKLGKELRSKLHDTIDAVLAVSGNHRLIEQNRLLQWQLSLRNPYIDPLNVMQAIILRKLRNTDHGTDEEREVLCDALVITINGIAAGMRNTG